MIKSKGLKKLLGGIMLCSITILPTFAFANEAMPLYSASTFTYSFSNGLQVIPKRTFDDAMKHLKVTVATTSTGGVPTFQIDLIRYTGNTATKIGTQTVSTTSGNKVVNFLHVGKGHYGLQLRKTNNGKYLTGSGRIDKYN